MFCIEVTVFPKRNIWKQNVRWHSRTFTNFPLVNSRELCIFSDSFRRTVASIRELFLKLSFGTTKTAAYADKIYVCLFVAKNMIILIIIDIMCMYLGLISNLVSENNGYSLIWGHVRRVYSNRSKDAECFVKHSWTHSISERSLGLYSDIEGVQERFWTIVLRLLSCYFEYVSCYLRFE